MKYLLIVVTVLLGAGIFLFFGSSGVFNNGDLSGDFVIVRGNKFFVDVADDEVLRERGLSGRDSLEKNSGMLFVFDKPGIYGFWMKDMRFSIDIVWIRDGKVLGYEENLDYLDQSSIYYPPGEVDTVLEIGAGEVGEIGIEKGDYARLP